MISITSNYVAPFSFAMVKYLYFWPESTPRRRQLKLPRTKVSESVAVSNTDKVLVLMRTHLSTACISIGIWRKFISLGDSVAGLCSTSMSDDPRVVKQRTRVGVVEFFELLQTCTTTEGKWISEQFLQRYLPQNMLFIQWRIQSSTNHPRDKAERFRKGKGWPSSRWRTQFLSSTYL